MRVFELDKVFERGYFVLNYNNRQRGFVPHRNIKSLLFSLLTR